MIILSIALFASIFIALYFYKKHRIAVVREKISRLMEYELNPLIIANLRKENPGWTDKQVSNAITGFKEYMSLFITSPGKNLGMTSVGIDEVWHAFLRYDTLYKDFCMEFIGYVVEHKEHASTPGVITTKTKLNQDVIETKKAIIHSKEKYGTQFSAGNGSPSTGYEVPLIFSYDSSHNISSGWHYDSDVYHKIDNNSSDYTDSASIGGSGSFHTSDSIGSGSSCVSVSNYSSSGSSCSSSSGSSCSSSSGSSCSSGGD